MEERYFNAIYWTNKKAMKLAYNKHHHQFDKAGYPYFAHVLHIAERMNTEEETIAALLHNILEDTEVSQKEIEDLGFNQDIIEAIKLLTHKNYIPYMEYIENLKSNDLARKIKIQDLKHNLDTSRIDSNITDLDLKRIEKYNKALKYLEND